MPWTTPPTFSYGYPASVDDLNIIRNNLLYLYGEIYTTSSATLESEVKIESPFDEQDHGGTAAIEWIEHKTNDLYYRIRVKSEATTHAVRLYIRYYEDPYTIATAATPPPTADEMGEHKEEQTLVLADTYYLFTNSDVPVDISGWGLTVGEMYCIVISLDATSDDNQDCWVEVQFLHEAP
jgi:hypothetical protein